jgi:tetratricopeptide (TPR) repeat protein
MTRSLAPTPKALFFVALASLSLASLSLGPHASAQDAVAPADGQADEAARLTFELARQAFVAGDYETALQRFRQAYSMSARPGLLYNIAQTLDRLRRDEETVTALREYLEALPDSPNRSEVEARIRVLEASLERNRQQQQQHQQQQQQQHPQHTDPPPPSGSSLAILHPGVFIAAAGLALVGGGLAVWAGLETLSLNDQYNAATSYDAALALYDDADTFQLLTNVFIASAATFGVAAVVFAIITDWDAFGGGSDSASASLLPTFGVSPDGASLGVMGHL